MADANSPTVTDSRINSNHLASLNQQLTSLIGLQRGIEKESLRVATDGALSQLPHPRALGSPLTHEAITTDFSEAQLELITGVHDSPGKCLDELIDIHRFVYTGIDDELLWPSSMPCIVGEDDKIPVGRYGSSNIARAKTVYRLGLGLRYGRLMQTISGIHYNFSLPDSLWQALGIHTQDERTRAYFSLIRNFRRWSWLLIYLFGASPAVCRSFVRNQQHGLQPFDEGSLHLPYATSLRMGPLGYQSSAQSALHISYNSLDEYASSMVDALTRTYPAYAQMGIKHNDEYQQLNTAILQIENEFYGTIRPKPRINSGERPINALRQRGVEYVEVRCLDLNPFLPVGIDEQQISFLDTFLLLCLLADSAPDSTEESIRLVENQLAIVQRGRDPELELLDEKGNSTTPREWGSQLLDDCETIAKLLDQANATDTYSNALQAQRTRVLDAAQTPSALILQQMKDEQIPFFRFSMDQAIAHQAFFASRPLNPEEQRNFTESVRASIQRQHDMEAADTQSFDEFLKDYLALPAQ